VFAETTFEYSRHPEPFQHVMCLRVSTGGAAQDKRPTSPPTTPPRSTPKVFSSDADKGRREQLHGGQDYVFFLHDPAKNGLRSVNWRAAIISHCREWCRCRYACVAVIAVKNCVAVAVIIRQYNHLPACIPDVWHVS
jgi:hypothetical protein